MESSKIMESSIMELSIIKHLDPKEADRLRRTCRYLYKYITHKEYLRSNTFILSTIDNIKHEYSTDLVELISSEDRHNISYTIYRRNKAITDLNYAPAVNKLRIIHKISNSDFYNKNLVIKFKDDDYDLSITYIQSTC